MSFDGNALSNFIMLAPLRTGSPNRFGRVHHQEYERMSLMSQMQKLRGQTYLEDGAVTRSQLDDHDRHIMADDEDSWHLLRLRNDGSVSGCARILAHPPDVTYGQLRVSSCPLANSESWGGRVRNSIESEIFKARTQGRSIVEPGGWALAQDLRGSTEALSIVVGVLAWAQLSGGCVGFITATVRHGSASILRRLGGSPLDVDGQPAPAYFDPHYGCDMELLRFDCQGLNPRFGAALERTRNLLLSAPIFTSGKPKHQRPSIAA